MLDEKPNEPLVRSQRRAMDAKRSLFGIVAVAINQPKAFRYGEIHLIGRQGELAPNDAPHLYVNFRAVKCRFVGHLNIIDAGVLERVADHVFGLLPKLGLIYEFRIVSGEARGIVRAETHDVFLDAEDLEILNI